MKKRARLPARVGPNSTQVRSTVNGYLFDFRKLFGRLDSLRKATRKSTRRPVQLPASMPHQATDKQRYQPCDRYPNRSHRTSAEAGSLKPMAAWAGRFREREYPLITADWPAPIQRISDFSQTGRRTGQRSTAQPVSSLPSRFIPHPQCPPAR